MPLLIDYNLLFFTVQESGTTKDEPEKEILDISAKGAVVFVIVASTFLLLLYFFMSSWFIWVLIVLFCIGGIEVKRFLPLYLTVLWKCTFDNLDGIIIC